LNRARGAFFAGGVVPRRRPLWLPVATILSGMLDITMTSTRPLLSSKSIPSRSVGLAFSLLLAAGTAQAADPAPVFDDCPFSVSIPNFSASQPPEWKNWDTATFLTTQGDRTMHISPKGLVCIQTYSESPVGLIDSTFETMLEFTGIMSDFKQSWQRQGAQITYEAGNDIVAHLTKDSKEYWLEASLPQRGRCRVTVLEVQSLQTHPAAARPQ
jgi:hypothetical protein